MTEILDMLLIMVKTKILFHILSETAMSGKGLFIKLVLIVSTKDPKQKWNSFSKVFCALSSFCTLGGNIGEKAKETKSSYVKSFD